MQRKSILQLSWLAGIILLVALSLREYRGAVQTRAARIEAAAQQERMANAISLEVRRATSIEQECRLMEKRPGTRDGRGTAMVADKNPPVSQIESLMNDTQLQTLQLALERSRLAGHYRPFFINRSLSPAQTELVQALLMKREEQRMDLADVTALTRVNADDQAVEKLRRKLDENFRHEMAGLIGEANASSFGDYERVLPAWELVSRFAGLSAVAGNPLSIEQATALAQIIANASPAYQAGGVTDLNTVDWSAAARTATKVLSEPQVQSFSNSAPRYPIKDQGSDSAGFGQSFDF